MAMVLRAWPGLELRAQVSAKRSERQRGCLLEESLLTVLIQKQLEPLVLPYLFIYFLLRDYLT